MCTHGDPAYPLRIHLQAPFRQVQLTPEMEEHNKSMSFVRVAVEWIFGDVVNYFKFVYFKKNCKNRFELDWQNVHGLCYFKKCFNMLIWNTTSNFFELDSPTLEEYFI